MKKTKKDVLEDASSRNEVSPSSDSSNPTRKRRRGEDTHADSFRAVRSLTSSLTRRDPSRLAGRQDTDINNDNNDNDDDDGLEWLSSGRPSVVTFGDIGVFDTAGNDALDGLSYFSGQYVPSDVETVNEWRVADMPSGRSYHTAVALKDGRVLVVGGVVDDEYGNGVSSSVLSYDPHSNLWSDASDWPSLNEKRRFHATVLCRDTVYVVGGNNGINNSVNSIESLELTQVGDRNPRWTLLDSRLSGDRSGCAATTVGRYVVVMGGVDEKSVNVFDTESGNVYRGPNMTEERCDGAAVAVKDTIWMVGGFDRNRKYSLTVESLRIDPHRDFTSQSPQWERFDVRMQTPRRNFALTAVGHLLIVAGGSQ